MPSRQLPPVEIVRLVKKYKKDGGHNNTKSVWYSLNDLIKVISLISNLDDPSKKYQGDGIRLYFARYPQNYPEAQKRGKNTVVFVPTFNINNDTIHYDFIDAAEVADLSNQIGDPDSGVYPFDKQGYDHGELCPDICDGGNVGNP